MVAKQPRFVPRRLGSVAKHRPGRAQVLSPGPAPGCLVRNKNPKALAYW